MGDGLGGLSLGSKQAINFVHVRLHFERHVVVNEVEALGPRMKDVRFFEALQAIKALFVDKLILFPAHRRIGRLGRGPHGFRGGIRRGLVFGSQPHGSKNKEP